jgi:hypothetical protein
MVTRRADRARRHGARPTPRGQSLRPAPRAQRRNESRSAPRASPGAPDRSGWSAASPRARPTAPPSGRPLAPAALWPAATTSPPERPPPERPPPHGTEWMAASAGASALAAARPTTTYIVSGDVGRGDFALSRSTPRRHGLRPGRAWRVSLPPAGPDRPTGGLDAAPQTPGRPRAPRPGGPDAVRQSMDAPARSGRRDSRRTTASEAGGSGSPAVPLGCPAAPGSRRLPRARRRVNYSHSAYYVT